MRTLKIPVLTFFAASMLFLTACSDDNENEPVVVPDLKISEVKDLDGSAESKKDSAFFNLSLNKEVTSSEKWDIKFKGTTISVSGTAQLLQLSNGQLFETYTTAPASGFDATDIKGSGSWYNYTATTEPQHAIIPVPGKIIVLKTADGKYAKIEMISYYKGNPSTSAEAFKDLTTRPAAKTYTFRFVYQADGTTNLK
ncbi:MAG: HmuY family protein [Dyadobacter sp.]|uniref:HmuY family protein n=1 Tax=Dyadobacter sp. TaxID=1914288 RepID=UPI00326783A8